MPGRGYAAPEDLGRIAFFGPSLCPGSSRARTRLAAPEHSGAASRAVAQTLRLETTFGPDPQASALAFKVSNSPWSMAPESSSALALAIWSAAEAGVPATCLMYSAWAACISFALLI